MANKRIQKKETPTLSRAERRRAVREQKLFDAEYGEMYDSLARELHLEKVSAPYRDAGKISNAIQNRFAFENLEEGAELDALRQQLEEQFAICERIDKAHCCKSC